MAAPTEYYVDPGGTVNTGDGTVGSPWTPRTGPTKSAIQHALDTITRNATSGDKINIKAGTDDIQTAALVLTTYGTPAGGAGLWLRGYTTAADDGGIGGIDLNNGSYSLINQPSYTNYIDLNVHNNNVAGGWPLIYSTTGSQVINCEVHDGYDGINLQWGVVQNSNIYDINVDGISVGGISTVIGNYVSNSGTEKMTNAIFCNGTVSVHRNIISVDGTTTGIKVSAHWNNLTGNSVFSNGGTGKGIYTSGNTLVGWQSNLIEGFSGTGGVGIHVSEVTAFDITLARNAVYNCATAISAANAYVYNKDNETLGASPFAKSGANTFANRATYFAPVNTGNVLTGGWHGGFKGAVGPSGSGGGGLLTHPGMTGRING